MDQIICGCCRSLLMYTRGARSVRCLCCQTVNLTMNQVATVNCGNCCIALMYPYGAPSVKCAICYFITNVGWTPQSESETVVIENPTSIDQSGKPVNNIVVGVTTKPK